MHNQNQWIYSLSNHFENQLSNQFENQLSNQFEMSTLTVCPITLCGSTRNTIMAGDV